MVSHLFQEEILCFANQINVQTNLEQIVWIWNFADHDVGWGISEYSSDESSGDDDESGVHGDNTGIICEMVTDGGL